MAGRLPSDLGKSLPSIQQLAIGTNLFTGALPRSLNNLSQLQVFDVDSNNFTGVVPTELGRLQNLEVFMLDSNKFHANNEREWGFIASLTNCSKFQKLTIGWNRFSGNLPSSLANVSPISNGYGFPSTKYPVQPHWTSEIWQVLRSLIFQATYSAGSFLKA